MPDSVSRVENGRPANGAAMKIGIVSPSRDMVHAGFSFSLANQLGHHDL
jgi:hypothetical protein